MPINKVVCLLLLANAIYCITAIYINDIRGSTMWRMTWQAVTDEPPILRQMASGQAHCVIWM